MAIVRGGGANRRKCRKCGREWKSTMYDVCAVWHTGRFACRMRILDKCFSNDAVGATWGLREGGRVSWATTGTSCAHTTKGAF